MGNLRYFRLIWIALVCLWYNVRRKMSTLERFASAIEYPQSVPVDAVDYAFKADGGEVRCVDLGQRLVLLRQLTQSEEDLMRLAAYSAGRMLRENASLYWDEHRGAAVLAQEIPATASAHEMRMSFETFLDSCDWWLARMEAGPVNSSLFPEMVIRP